MNRNHAAHLRTKGPPLMFLVPTRCVGLGLFKTREDREEVMFAETLRHSDTVFRDTIEESCNCSTTRRNM